MPNCPRSFIWPHTYEYISAGLFQEQQQSRVTYYMEIFRSSKVNQFIWEWVACVWMESVLFLILKYEIIWCMMQKVTCFIALEKELLNQTISNLGYKWSRHFCIASQLSHSFAYPYCSLMYAGFSVPHLHSVHPGDGLKFITLHHYAYYRVLMELGLELGLGRSATNR